jgi:hypothetical protein
MGGGLELVGDGERQLERIGHRAPTATGAVATLGQK